MIHAVLNHIAARSSHSGSAGARIPPPTPSNDTAPSASSTKSLGCGRSTTSGCRRAHRRGAIALVCHRLVTLPPRRGRARSRPAIRRHAAAVSSHSPACSCSSSASSAARRREVVHNSQVAVLVDVSQSMGLGEDENTTDTSATRIEAVVDALERQPAHRRAASNARRQRRSLRPRSRADRVVAEGVKSRESRVKGQTQAIRTPRYCCPRPSTLDPRPNRLAHRAAAARHANAARPGAGR